MQKFSVVRLQIGVQNRADSGHRQTAERICRTIRTSFPKEIRKLISVIFCKKSLTIYAVCAILTNTGTIFCIVYSTTPLKWDGV